MIKNSDQRDQAAKLPLHIKEILSIAGVKAAELDAIAISAGPGSYTGLRVGTATAKGLCYAWKKPLIAISTLQLMANGLIAATGGQNVLYCPMIDARRMEVFTAVYDVHLTPLLAPQAMILDEQSYQAWLSTNDVYFFGDGAPKWEKVIPGHARAKFPEYTISAAHMASLADKSFINNEFEDVAYFTPHYLKAFFHPGSK